MPAPARAVVAFGLFLAASPQAMASEAPRFDPAQFVVADTSGAPLRLGVAAGVGPSERDPIVDRIFADAPTGARAGAFELNFDRQRREWMRRKPPPVVFREPFPRRRSFQDRRGEGVAVVIRSTEP